MIRLLSRPLTGALFLALRLWGQDETGGLIGKVVDPSGAPAAAATIQLERRDFNERYRGVTDSGGEFEIRDLPPDTYNVFISLNGFLNKTLKNLKVTAGKPVDLGVLNLGLTPCNTLGGPICDEVQALKPPVGPSRSSKDIPIVTVCEILREADRYEGINVNRGGTGREYDGRLLVKRRL